MAAELLALAGDGFRIRETDHFTIAHDSTYNDLRVLIGRLEGTYEAVWSFCEAIELQVEPPQSRLRVLFFNRSEDFARHCDRVGLSADRVAGFFSPESNVAVFGNVMTRPEIQELTGHVGRLRNRIKDLQSGPDAASTRQEHSDLRRRMDAVRLRRDAIVEKFNRLVIQHETAHQVFYNLGVHDPEGGDPPWLVEGLACLFEIPQTSQTSKPDRVNQMRLADLRTAFGLVPGDMGVCEADAAEAFTSGRLLPVAELIRGKDLWTEDETQLSYRYAQAWSLVHYLSGKHRAAFSEYLRLLRSQPAGRVDDFRSRSADFEGVFGVSGDDLQRLWLDYVVHLEFKPEQALR